VTLDDAAHAEGRSSPAALDAAERRADRWSMDALAEQYLERYGRAIAAFAAPRPSSLAAMATSPNPRPQGRHALGRADERRRGGQNRSRNRRRGSAGARGVPPAGRSVAVESRRAPAGAVPAAGRAARAAAGQHRPVDGQRGRHPAEVARNRQRAVWLAASSGVAPGLIVGIVVGLLTSLLAGLVAAVVVLVAVALAVWRGAPKVALAWSAPGWWTRMKSHSS